MALKIDALTKHLRGTEEEVEAHLQLVTRDIEINDTRTRIHCYYVSIDAHNRVRTKALAEYLRGKVIDYAIPRSALNKAQRHLKETGSSDEIVNLAERAKRLFTHLHNTGEGGEILLFVISETILKLTQILCKMTLKTSPNVHYHGSDGVYAKLRDGGGLDIYWGESKMIRSHTDSIRECLSSLSPYLIEEESEESKRSQDIMLANEFANFEDECLVDGLRKFLDRNKKESLQLRHCGVALAGFDIEADANSEREVAEHIKSMQNDLVNYIKSRIQEEKIEDYDIHFICIPMPSVEIFRKEFLTTMGLEHES